MSRNTLKLDTSGFEHLLQEIDSLGGNTRKVAELALKHASTSIMNATILAVKKANLPAQGKYSTEDTSRSIIHFPQVQWDGNVAWVPVGFDFSKPGAGGFLISGTPRMQPDAELVKIYKKTRFINQVKKEMFDYAWDEMEKLWEG